MSKLDQIIEEVNTACDGMIEQLEWFNGERGLEVDRLAKEGHEPSLHLVTDFKVWYAIYKLGSPMFVEACEKMIVKFKDYRQAGYVK